MEKNQIIKLEITDISSSGSGVGRYDNMCVFVPQSAVGDVLEVRVLKVKSSYAFGKIESIIEPSKTRVEIDCSSFSKCGGCVYRHISYESEAKIKENTVKEIIKRIGGIEKEPESIVTDLPTRYRNKAQYPVNQNYQVGFFAPHSHRIVPCNDCLLQPYEFYEISALFENWCKKTNQSIYNEETGKGLIRHLYLRKAVVTSQIMVCVVINGEALPQSDLLINELKNLLGENLKTVVLNINTKKTNVILDTKLKNLYGDGYIYDELGGITVRLNPLSFYQVNHTMAEKLYKKVEEYAKPQNQTVLDLYCGAGTIGLSLHKKAKEIIGVEIIPEAIKDAEYNAKINNINNARFICKDAAKAAKTLKEEGIKPDVVIVDPPRKGCSEELLEIISKDFAPKRLVYVSCDPATLARDIKILGSKGYTLSEYTPFDLFPSTAHVETICLLKKADVKEGI